MAISAREAAVQTLAACRKRAAWSDSFLGALIRREGIDKRDASLAAKLCYGVLQNKALCDFYISKFSTTPPHKMEPVVLDILRVSVYQIVFLTKIPASAAVNEGVELVKKRSNPRAAGLVNAVLRKIAENADKLPQPPDLSTKYSHPEWLVAMLIEDLGEAGAEAFLAENNREAPLTAQVNTLKTDTEALLSRLESAGVRAIRHGWLSDCIEISGAGDLERLAPFENGELYIQDAAARCAVLAAAPMPGDSVLDACAAPGGKSFAAAIRMKNSGGILACDIHEKKLKLIRSGSDRLGIDIVRAECRDAKESAGELSKAFDVVLADVPCSGMGVIRRKPEIREKSRESIWGLPRIQLDILKNISEYVKPGGVLLYSTCTVISRENDGVTAEFLSQNPGFEPEAFTLPGEIGEVKSGRITLYPHLHRTDGFYICKLRKI